MQEQYRYDKVLVIDDTALDCFIAGKVMKSSSFAKDIVCLDSATAALKYLDTLAQNPDALPELIFLDLNMPDMDGFGFLAEYKNLPCHIKKKSIVMLTSSILEKDKTHALSNEYVRSFISKPLSQDALNRL